MPGRELALQLARGLDLSRCASVVQVLVLRAVFDRSVQHGACSAAKWPVLFCFDNPRIESALRERSFDGCPAFVKAASTAQRRVLCR